MERLKYSRSLKSAPSSDTFIFMCPVSKTQGELMAFHQTTGKPQQLGSCSCVSLLKQVCVIGLGSLFASPLLEPQLQSMTTLTLGKAGEVEGQTGHTSMCARDSGHISFHPEGILSSVGYSVLFFSSPYFLLHFKYIK